MLSHYSFSNKEFFNDPTLDREVVRRFDAQVEVTEVISIENERLYVVVEQIEEQSEFRRSLIEDILKACDRLGSKKELVDKINQLSGDSYVEL